MITPTKHEDLSSSYLVVGGSLLRLLKKKSYATEDMYSALRAKHSLNLTTFFDIVLFLWLSGFIEINEYELRLKGTTT